MNTFDVDGYIVSWSSPENPVKLSDLRLALSVAGFNQELARDMAPRNAFSRAAKQLSDDRIIRKVDEGDDKIRFQFTREFLQGKQLEYVREFDLLLHKTTGVVECEDAGMQQIAQELVDEHRKTRMASDVTRLIQKIFESQDADLVPIRKQGGTYFVPSGHASIVTQIDSLLKQIGGELRAWEITARSAHTQQAVSQSMSEYLLGLVDEYQKTLVSISADSKDSTLTRRCERLAELQTKLELHSPMLRDLATVVQGALDNAEATLLAAVGQPSS